MDTWVYVFDEFKPVDINVDRLLKLFEKDPLKLFEDVKEVLAEINIKEIKDVRVYETYHKPDNSELLIEYLVNCEHGMISVKIIHSRSPKETLYNYYAYEKQTKKPR